MPLKKKHFANEGFAQNQSCEKSQRIKLSLVNTGCLGDLRSRVFESAKQCFFFGTLGKKPCFTTHFPSVPNNSYGTLGFLQLICRKRLSP